MIHKMLIPNLALITITLRLIPVCPFSVDFPLFGCMPRGNVFTGVPTARRFFSPDTSLHSMNFNFDKVLSDDDESGDNSADSMSAAIDNTNEGEERKVLIAENETPSLAEDIAKISRRAGPPTNQMTSRIKGCEILRVGRSDTEFDITVDGDEADLGSFSKVVYKKVIMDAKQQRYTGFRPGSIPPFLEVTYRLFAMDEVAREATCEALEQNNMRPFDGCRENMTFETIIYRQSRPSKKKKKKKRKKKIEGQPILDDAKVEDNEIQEPMLKFESMKEAVNAGWQPGQSFSFIARNIKAQEMK